MENGTMKDIGELFDIRYPILQGGMAWVAEANLAAAVSNGGGLGVIAAGNADADYVRAQIRKARELTNEPFGVNVMLMNPAVDEIMRVLCEERVSVATTGAGNPGKYVQGLKEAGVKVVPVVSNVALAIRLERTGADALIAEGMESGGHIGELTTMALVPQIVDAVDVPVIAAGGIADGRGVAAAFMLGASGVQLGTRFLTATECTIAQPYKDRVLKAKDSDTVVTGRPTGHPVRVLKNRFTKEALALEKNPGLSLEEYETFLAGTLRAAVVDGDIEHGSLMSGQIAGLVKQEQPAAEIIRELFAGAAGIYRERALDWS
ncbi:MAG: enoyl-[acyl-carrier-protein] reductase FabK [Clostridiales Family XIII bacterium]|jgi:enoyl-[acyl-carrier protein] reductase II|nr:enoyl-[acyl-carrier-protein] reductase FabK [Clostridiales Family XIII bacterium]